MGTHFQDLEKLFVYMYDLIALGNGTLDEHLSEVDEILSRLLAKELQVNSSKSTWTVQEIYYLGFTLTRIVVKPQPKCTSYSGLRIPSQ